MIRSNTPHAEETVHCPQTRSSRPRLYGIESKYIGRWASWRKEKDPEWILYKRYRTKQEAADAMEVLQRKHANYLEYRYAATNPK